MIYCLTGDVYKILSVDTDGAVKLKKYLDDGTLEAKIVRSKFSIFTGKYKLTTKIRTFLEGWPDNDVSENDSLEAAFYISLLQAAICDHYINSSRPAVDILDKPRSGVFSKDAYTRKGTFKLPVYGKVFEADAEKALQKVFGFEVA